MNIQHVKQEQRDIKENFCGACLAVPLALAGAGVAGAGAKSKGMHKKTRKIMLWGGISFTLLFLIIAIMYLKKCKSCR